MTKLLKGRINRMDDLYVWAKKWNIPWEAIRDLQKAMGTLPEINTSSVSHPPTNEAEASARIRLDAAKSGALLFRNNVGAMQDDNGRIVRYGLANESRQMNENIKSSDLIGIQSVNITSGMVGQTIGQFIAIEMKAPGWVFSGTPREVAQRKFIELVISRGGAGKFSTGS